MLFTVVVSHLGLNVLPQPRSASFLRATDSAACDFTSPFRGKPPCTLQLSLVKSKFVRRCVTQVCRAAQRTHTVPFYARRRRPERLKDPDRDLFRVKWLSEPAGSLRCQLSTGDDRGSGRRCSSAVASWVGCGFTHRCVVLSGTGWVGVDELLRISRNI